MTQDQAADATGPAAKPTLLLHFGPGKTGSSAIQEWLAAIAGELIPRGILYPPPIKEIAKFSGNGQDLAALLHRPHGATGEGISRALEELLTHYVKLAAERKCHTILLSSEFLPEAPQENLELLRRHACAHFDVCVIGFVRDPYWWLWSAWGQSVKRGGLDEDFSEYALKNISYYGDILSNFVGLFEHARLSTFRHENLLKDFSYAAGIPEELVRTAPEERVNRSLDREELAALLSVNRVFKDAELSTRISDRMLSERPQSPSYKHFNPELAHTIRIANAPTLAAISPLIINSDIPIIDDPSQPTELAAGVHSTGRMGVGLFDIVLTAIGAWYEERSLLTRLQRLAMTAPSEARFGEVLPEGFNSIEYLLINPDVLAAGADPIAHYLAYGCNEGRHFRRPEPVINPAYTSDQIET